MGIGVLSILINQWKVQQDDSLAVMKMEKNTGRETATQMAEILRGVMVGPNLGRHLDEKV